MLFLPILCCMESYPLEGFMLIVDVSVTVPVSAAVAMVSGRQGQRGVVRFVATGHTSCLVDGTIDGLQPAHRHAVLIHEFGDLSSDCDR